jgi:L-asparagine transporter-like permease
MDKIVLCPIGSGLEATVASQGGKFFTANEPAVPRRAKLNTEQVRLLMSGLLLAAVIVITAVILSNHLSVRQP